MTSIRMSPGWRRVGLRTGAPWPGPTAHAVAWAPQATALCSNFDQLVLPTRGCLCHDAGGAGPQLWTLGPTKERLGHRRRSGGSAQRDFKCQVGAAPGPQSRRAAGVR